MDSPWWDGLFGGATNQFDTLSLIQYNATLSAEARDCELCGQPLGMRSGNWDAFPAGVKFDPSDEELLLHLRAEIGRGDTKSHPLINNFIHFLDGEDGICQAHPENLPGVKKDGSSKHFFHRPTKAYTTGTRKRRRIHSEDDEPGVDTRWHKTGKTRSVHDNRQILGWKKIMVLYKNMGSKKSKPEKTNWVLHQYHLGETEEETDGELVVCKVIYQKHTRHCTGGRPAKGATKMDSNQGSRDMSVICRSSVSRVTPVTPKVDTPETAPLIQHETLHDYLTEWTEVGSTSGKSCQSESDNWVGGEHLPMSSKQDEPQFLGSYGVPLSCDEDLHVESLLNTDFYLKFRSLEEPFYVSNPNEDYPATDDILNGTPLLSSQETMGVISFKPGFGSLDNDDSLSST